LKLLDLEITPKILLGLLKQIMRLIPGEAQETIMAINVTILKTAKRLMKTPKYPKLTKIGGIKKFRE